MFNTLENASLIEDGLCGLISAGRMVMKVAKDRESPRPL
jgi:hypothetical protein